MTELKNRFSAPANRVLSNIQFEVQRLNHTRIEPEHVMLVLMKEKQGAAYEALEEMGVDLDALDEMLRESLAQLEFPEGDLSMSDETKRILGLSMDAVASLERPYLGTEHLLVALMRDLSNRVYPILRRAGITYNGLLSSIKETPLEVMTEEALKAQQESAAVNNGEVLTGFGVVKRISLVFWLLLAGTIGFALAAYWQWFNTGIAVFLFVTFGWIVSVSLHEFGHALVGYWGGDRGVLERGYLTLNPLKYTHSMLSVVLPVLFLALGGIGLPGGAVYINQAAIPNRQTRSALSAAGPMMTGAIALLLALPFTTGWYVNSVDAHTPFWAGLAFLVFVQIWALALNLIPFPGLDGFGVIRPYLTDTWNRRANQLGSWIWVLFIAVFIWDNPVQRLFWQLIGSTIQMLGVNIDLLIRGMELYHFW